MKTTLRKKLALLMMSVVLLGACEQGDGTNAESSADKPTENAAKQEQQVLDEIAEPLSTIYYPAVIKDGHYNLNNNRGNMAGESSQINLENMERGLYQLAQAAFPTDQYVLSEGGVIGDDQAAEWLSAESDDNPAGLNPANSSATDRSAYEPKYLNSILEYDLMQADENGDYQLAGLAIALAINSVDTFENGTTKEEITIDKETAIAKGQETAIKVIARIRENENHQNIPIQVALFLNTASDDLAGGTFFAEAISNQENELSEWISYEHDYVAYGVDEAPDSEDTAAFTRFRTSIEDFFPVLSGLSGVGLYENDKLTDISININTQFDGYTEIIALTQYAIDEANNIFRNDVPIRIEIETPNGLAAVLTREAGSTTFAYVIL